MPASGLYRINDDECIEFKMKSLARREVAKALKEGRLKRPPCCDLCTLEHSKLEAHHVDYGRPLCVYWLCCTCHGVAHKKNHSLNPDNNTQTPSASNWRRDENQVVSFSLPFENFIAVKKSADERNISVPKLLRGLVLREFPVEDEQINFGFKTERMHDNTQNDEIQGAQNLDQNQDALLQQKRQKLQELRRTRHQNVPRMEELVHQVL